MSYSIKSILHHAPDKAGLHKIQILIIYKRMKFTLATNYKVTPAQFDNGRCKGFKLASDINHNLTALKERYEKILLGVIETDPGKETLQQLFAQPQHQVQQTSMYKYIVELLKVLQGTISPGRYIHFKTLADQLKNFGDIELNKVSFLTAKSFEKYLKTLGLQQNTLNSKMKLFIRIINYAKLEKLVPKDCLDGYTKPLYIQPIPDYLTEDELNNFKAITDASQVVRYKTAGYYFLLSCYLGYRISDLEIFDAAKVVRGDKIIIRAGKNKELVMIPLYPKLDEIIEQVKQYPFYFTQQSMRKYVKELAMLAGLSRKIKVHTARHTFAIMLIEKGFSIDEVAQLLGDSRDIARIYARITNTHLHNKFKELLV